MDVLERVGSSRLMLDGKFPYPDEIGCIIHCAGEATEYRDARRRIENPEEKRNNGKQHDPRKELGQCAYMLLSGLLYNQQRNVSTIRLPLDYAQYEQQYDQEYVYFGLLSELGALGQALMDDEEIYIIFEQYNQVWEGICILCYVHGWDVAELIEDTCADFERKHLEPVGPDMRNGGHTA